MDIFNSNIRFNWGYNFKNLKRDQNDKETGKQGSKNESWNF